MSARRMAGGARSDLSFACACGTVSGELIGAGPGAGDHVVCHCTDCQAFAARFGAAGRILDHHAGTALYQCRCAAMRLVTGRDRLACIHLTRKPTLRWYARCCGTPMFSTYRDGRIPYITTLVANCDPDRREQILGPPIGHLFAREGSGDVRHLVPMSMAGMMRRFFKRMVRDIIAGDRRRSALFDPQTLVPIATPERAVMPQAANGRN